MSDHELGAYTPPTTDAPLSFDARQPVPGARSIPFTLIISVLVLIALAAVILVFYRSGVRQSGQPPQTVGAPVGDLKAAPPAAAQPQDPAAGLQIYRPDAGEAAAPKFTAPPEQPQARSAPIPVVVTPPPAAAKPPAAQALRPALPAAPPAKVVAPAPKAAAAVPAAPKPAPPAAPVAKAAPAAGTPGTMVQIGAFSSQAIADTGWNDAVAVAPGLAAGKGKTVEKVEKDGHTLFRTTVTGFADRAAASAFCGKLKAAGKACFVK
jgi:hypothetical protein